MRTMYRAERSSFHDGRTRLLRYTQDELTVLAVKRDWINVCPRIRRRFKAETNSGADFCFIWWTKVYKLVNHDYPQSLGEIMTGHMIIHYNSYIQFAIIKLNIGANRSIKVYVFGANENQNELCFQKKAQ